MVAVVILNWNGKQVTVDCLHSLLSSDYQEMSIVVVDNGSQDGSAAYIATHFPQVELLQSATNLGTTGGNNLGIRHAWSQNADYFLLLNNDTLLEPSCISALVAFADLNPAYGALTPKIFFHEPADLLWFAGGDYNLWRGVAHHRGYKQKDVGQFDRGYDITFATACALLIRTEVFSTIGLLDETFFSYAEDVDFSLRMQKAGYKLGFVPNTRLWHRIGFSLRSQNDEATRYYYYVRNSLYVISKHATLPQLLCAYPYFALHTLITLGIKSTMRGKFQELIALWKGVVDFIRMWKENHP